MPVSPIRSGRPGRFAYRLGAVVAVAVLVAACGSSSATSTTSPGQSAAASSGASAAASSAASPTTKAGRDPSKPIADRVSALLSQMTLAEKIGQMTQVENGSIDAAASGSFAVGSIPCGCGGPAQGRETPTGRDA